MRDSGLRDAEMEIASALPISSRFTRASPATRRRFSHDLLNFTLASLSVSRQIKRGKDATGWMPNINRCWFASTVVKVKRKYGLTVDRRERDALERVLKDCP